MKHGNHRDRPDASAFESGTWTTDSVPCPPDPMLAAHVDGELDDARSKAIETHLDRCTVCDAEARRLEGLSHLMRAWDVAHPEVVPPPRLASRILRDVEVESGVRRRETLASFRRVRLKSVAAVLVIAFGAWLGAVGGAGPGDPSSAARGGYVAGVPVVGVPVVGGPFVVAEVGRGSFEPRLAIFTTSYAGLAEVAIAEHLSEATAALSRRGEPVDFSVLADPATRDAFLPWALLTETTRRIGEGVVIREGGRAIPYSVIGAYEGVRRWEEWIAARQKRALEPPTRDPSEAGTPLGRLLALPSESGTSAFWASLRSVEDPAKRRHGGTSFRPLPAPSSMASDRSDRSDRSERSERSMPRTGTVLDLSEAVRTGSVRILEDLVPNVDVVVVQVRNLASPVLVPAGELLSGGIAPRVVAHGAWLPAGSDAYQVKLSCRAVGPVVGSAAATPVATGLLAGPALRGALSRGESAAGIRAIIRAQLRGAALEPVSILSTSGVDLLRLYALDGVAAVDLDRRAREIVARLGDDARGFAAVDAAAGAVHGSSDGAVHGSSDGSSDGAADGAAEGVSGGRFQGFESVNLEGAARKALLLRLVTGYLAEAGSRSSVDGPRSGVDAMDVLSVLVRRPVRLTPPVRGAGLLTAEEPRTGVAFESVVDDQGAVVLTSGLLPDVR